MNKTLDGLNQEQQEAVTVSQGPLLIIAGAGTGKTTVITRRIAWLISEGLARPEEILALTFTDKAAREMEERVDLLVPYGYTDIWISTFHAFGDRLLRENALIAGLNPDFKVLSRAEAAVLVREHLFEFDLSYYRPLSDPTRFIDALISVFSRARDEDISPESYLKFANELSLKVKAGSSDKAQEEEALQQLEVARAYCKYQELLSRHGVADFANQFYLALALLRERAAVLRRYQQQFKYILVDEFQDTNLAQFEIVRLLGGVHGNITVVADDDQCIYRWRGAAYSNVMNFMEAYPQARQISLIRNYRSAQVILDCAYRLIQNNNPERFEVKAGINKRLTGLQGGGAAPQHLHFDTHSSEADGVARMIKEKVQSGDYRYRDFAILVRSNSDAQSFLQALNMQAIPWQFSGNQGLYSRQEVKLCISFLRVAANIADSMNLYYLASSEVYRLDPASLSLCAHYARRRNISLYEVLTRLVALEDLAGLPDAFKDKAAAFVSDLEKFLARAPRESTGRLLYGFLTDTGYLKGLTSVQSIENETKIQNLAKFFGLVQEFSLVTKEDRVATFVNYLDLLIDAGDDPPTAEADLDTDAVNVLTIHKAKGLEFRVVFMVSLVQGRFPWPRRRQPIELPDELIREVLPAGDSHIQEERRLFYVGMTRAKEELYLTSAADYGGSRLKKVSQFVSEAMGKPCEEASKQKASALEAISRFAPPQESAAPAAGSVASGRQIHLSYYQIDDYLTCPLKYKYVNILRVPIMEHHTVIYGRAMHDAVTKYFLFKKSGKKVELGDILEAFRQSFDPQGFLDIKHQEERSRKGQEALARFFAAEEKSKTTPVFIEKDFSFTWEGVRITGRFDRVDQGPEGTLIMDFKTSEIKTQKDADKRVKESLQLDLYALAYQSIFRVLPDKVALYFLESGIIGTRQVSDDDLGKIKDNIRMAAEGIREQRFAATPAYMACTYCAYSQICPSSAGRE